MVKYLLRSGLVTVILLLSLFAGSKNYGDAILTTFLVTWVFEPLFLDAVNESLEKRRKKKELGINKNP